MSIPGLIRTTNLPSIELLNQFIKNNISKEIQLFGVNANNLLSPIGDFYHSTVFSLEDEGYSFKENNKYKLGNVIGDAFLMQDYDLIEGYFNETTLPDELSQRYETELQDILTSTYLEAFNSLTELGIDKYLLTLRHHKNNSIEDDYASNYIEHNTVLSNSLVLTLTEVYNKRNFISAELI